MAGETLRIIPLGGVGEVGKNLTVYELDDDIVVVDAGLAFPRDEHLGVDLILPDISRTSPSERIGSAPSSSRIRTRITSVRLPYLLREIPVPEVWGTRLTLGLAQSTAGRARAPELGRVEGGQAGGGPRADRRLPDRLRPRRALDSRRRLHRPGDTCRPRPAHRRLEARPHAGGRPAHGCRPPRRARDPGRRPHARRLDERRASGRHGLGAARRRGVPADHPAARGPRPDRVLRLERPPDAAGDRRRRPGGPQGRGRRALDAEEHEHLAQPRLRRRAGGDADPAERARPVPPARGADPLHRQPGRADVGADPDRLQRPPGGVRGARRHRDPLRAAGSRERAARPRHDQPAGEVRRRGAPPGERACARVGPRPRRGAAHDARPRPAEGRDARARRVPDARRPWTPRAGERRAGVVDHS